MRSAKNKTFLEPIKLGSKYGLDVLGLYRKELDKFSKKSLKKTRRPYPILPEDLEVPSVPVLLRYLEEHIALKDLSKDCVIENRTIHTSVTVLEIINSHAE